MLLAWPALVGMIVFAIGGVVLLLRFRAVFATAATLAEQHRANAI